ncbi:MAG: alpha/beta hydrolase-fold protein [Bacteroidota bacterium]
MNPVIFKIPLILFSVMGLTTAAQQLVIDSELLATKTDVRIFQLGEEKEIESIVYFTDGEKLLQAGFRTKLNTLFKTGKIPPAYLVFVSSVDLNDSVDKRNTYFFCNPDYLNFFENELLPKVEKTIGKSFTPEQRGLVGISFGGLNAAWFSAKSFLFTKYALLSPVTYPCKKVIEDIAFSKNERLKIYISTGINDAENYVGLLENIYKSKHYEIHTEKTQGRHDFQNWAGQLNLVFNFLFNN